MERKYRMRKTSEQTQHCVVFHICSTLPEMLMTLHVINLKHDVKCSNSWMHQVTHMCTMFMQYLIIICIYRGVCICMRGRKRVHNIWKSVQTLRHVSLKTESNQSCLKQLYSVSRAN